MRRFLFVCLGGAAGTAARYLFGGWAQRVLGTGFPYGTLGVNLMAGLCEQAARMLGKDFDLEVVELHHKDKRDAPSGTAVAIAEALARGRQTRLDEVKRFSREGEVGPRTVECCTR